VKLLILEAARVLFAAKGFRGTSTREIAEAAGVAEILLFRNFGSKAELYSSAVVRPLREFFERWLESDPSERDKTDTDTDTETQTREFVARLYRMVRENRRLIVSYLGMSLFEPGMIRGLEHSRALDEALERLAADGGEHLARLGPSAPNARVWTRAVIGMVLSMGLFDDLRGGDRLGRPRSDEVIDEMTQLLLHGSLHRPGRPGLDAL
jgi:AcrR family transcriptional regulator